MVALIGECKSKAIPEAIYIQSSRENASWSLKINTLSYRNNDETQDYNLVVKTDILRHLTFSSLVSCYSATALVNEQVKDQSLLSGM